jgi:hypothetical protein
VGHYAGFVRLLRQLQLQQQQQQHEAQPGSSSSSSSSAGVCSERVSRNLAAMEECLSQFPLYDPLVRLTVRQCCGAPASSSSTVAQFHSGTSPPPPTRTQDESLQELLEALRGKHKAVSAALTRQAAGCAPGSSTQDASPGQQQASLSF